MHKDETGGAQKSRVTCNHRLGIFCLSVPLIAVRTTGEMKMLNSQTEASVLALITSALPIHTLPIAPRSQ